MILGGQQIKKNVRGPTYMAEIWGRQDGKRTPVSFDEYGQPDDEENTKKFEHFLGTIAQNAKYASLEYETWLDILEADKKMMLKEVEVNACLKLFYTSFYMFILFLHFC